MSGPIIANVDISGSMILHTSNCLITGCNFRGRIDKGRQKRDDAIMLALAGLYRKQLMMMAMMDGIDTSRLGQDAVLTLAGNGVQVVDCRFDNITDLGIVEE